MLRNPQQLLPGTMPGPRRAGSGGRSQGFSLIMVSILLTVAAVVMVSVLPGNEAGDYNNKAIGTFDRLDRVEQAMTAFMAGNGRRPCPASGQYAVSNANFGVEAATPGTCTGGTPAAPLGPDAGTSNVVAGSIPTKTLNIPDDYAFDEWGRRYTYVVDKRATDTTACITLQDAGTSGGITVRDGTGATYASVMAAYVSHGPDGHGAWPAQGSTVANRINKGSSDTATLDNASVNAAFATSFDNVIVKKETTATFDDQVYIPYYKNTCCIGTSLCVLPSEGFRFNGNNDEPEMQAGGYGLLTADLNGDGIKDLIMLNNSQNQWWEPGQAMIIWGRNDGSFVGPYTPANLNGTVGTLITGMTQDKGSYYSFGMTTGDLNGDGIDDLVISHGYNNGTGTYVIWGHTGAWPATKDVWTTPLNGADGVKFLNPIDAAGGVGGCQSVVMGDFNDDNIQDLLIGCTMYNNSVREGRGYVWFGHTQASSAWTTNINLNTVNGTNGFKLDIATLPHGGTKTNSYLGMLVAAGDLNDDGIDDIAIAQGNNSGSSCGGCPTGWVYVIFGHSGVWTTPTDPEARMNGTNGVLMDWAYVDFWGGGGLSMADFNGDGIKDLFIGTPLDNVASTEIGYIVWGHSGAWASSLNFNSGAATPAGSTKILGIPAGSGAGWTPGIGDVNDDGINDLIIGAPTEGATDIGATYVLFGASGAWAASKNISALNGTDGFKLLGVAANDQSGYTAGAGDVNGDGIDDVLVGAVYTDPSGNTNAGTVYVVYGKTTWSATYNLSDVP